MGSKRYYIAGPMTGYTNFNREAFNAMCDDLRKQGHTVLNPAVLPDGLTQSQYMDICLAMLRCVTHVMMLKDWEFSSGAKIEHDLAIKSDLILEYQR